MKFKTVLFLKMSLVYFGVITGAIVEAVRVVCRAVWLPFTEEGRDAIADILMEFEYEWDQFLRRKGY